MEGFFLTFFLWVFPRGGGECARCVPSSQSAFEVFLKVSQSGWLPDADARWCTGSNMRIIQKGGYLSVHLMAHIHIFIEVFIFLYPMEMS